MDKRGNDSRSERLSEQFARNDLTQPKRSQRKFSVVIGEYTFWWAVREFSRIVLSLLWRHHQSSQQHDRADLCFANANGRMGLRIR